MALIQDPNASTQNLLLQQLLRSGNQQLAVSNRPVNSIGEGAVQGFNNALGVVLQRRQQNQRAQQLTGLLQQQAEARQAAQQQVLQAQIEKEQRGEDRTIRAEDRAAERKRSEALLKQQGEKTGQQNLQTGLQNAGIPTPFARVLSDPNASSTVQGIFATPLQRQITLGQLQNVPTNTAAGQNTFGILAGRDPVTGLDIKQQQLSVDNADLTNQLNQDKVNQIGVQQQASNLLNTAFTAFQRGEIDQNQLSRQILGVANATGQNPLDVLKDLSTLQNAKTKVIESLPGQAAPTLQLQGTGNPTVDQGILDALEKGLINLGPAAQQADPVLGKPEIQITPQVSPQGLAPQFKGKEDAQTDLLRQGLINIGGPGTGGDPLSGSTPKKKDSKSLSQAAVNAVVSFITPHKGRVTSGFGTRNNPVTGVRHTHNGIDIAGKRGDPVLAAAPGRVIFAADKGPNGNLVQIKHADGSVSSYAHLNNFSVKVGDEVQGGVPVGGIGSTGRSTGPHLHFGIRDAQGKPVDPRKLFG